MNQNIKLSANQFTDSITPKLSKEALNLFRTIVRKCEKLIEVGEVCYGYNKEFNEIVIDRIPYTMNGNESVYMECGKRYIHIKNADKLSYFYADISVAGDTYYTICPNDVDFSFDNIITKFLE